MVNETCRVISFHQGAATELEANVWVTTQNIFPSIPSIAGRKSRRSYPDNLRGRSIVWGLNTESLLYTWKVNFRFFAPGSHCEAARYSSPKIY